MIDDKHLQLIHQEIDGENSSEESEAVQKYMLKNEEAKTLYSDLNALSNLLNQVDAKDPSPNLKKNILNSIQPYKSSSREKTPVIGGLIQNIKSVFQIKYGFAFASGLAAGLILFVLLGNQNLQTPVNEISNFYVTMIPKEADNNLQSASFFEINLDQVTGSVHVKNGKDVVLLELQLNSSQNIDVYLGFNKDELEFSGLSKGDHPSRGAIEYDANQVNLTTKAESSTLILFKRLASDAKINFRLSQNGNTLLEEVMTTGN